MHSHGTPPQASHCRLMVLTDDQDARQEVVKTFASNTKLEVGMPHLDIFGLSETFCLSSAGNHHWSLISRMASKSPINWKNSQGERVYASFVYTAISYFRDFEVQEGDVVEVNCFPLGFCSPFFITETEYLNANSDVLVRVRLMSTFLTKNGYSNSKFARSSILVDHEPFGASILEETNRRYKEMNRFDDKDLEKMADYKINPSVDFNAANFMYFVNYCNLFKRYESPELSSSFPLKSREIAYFANIDPFEEVTVYSRQDDMDVQSAMRRSSDRKCIARSSSVSFQG
jgi:probable biosynthetic protein (TIGR04099 family)